MNKIFVLAILVLVYNCKSSVNTEAISKTITSNQIEEMVKFLASDDIQGRRAGSEGIDKAATYIENQFKFFGVKPYFETFRDNFKFENTKFNSNGKGSEYVDAFNVVGFIEGSDPELKKEIIVLGAHYDHIGIGESIKKYGGTLMENDSLANGANDNASGTSAVLAMANYFAVKKNNKRSIMFALFSAEEWGLKGSRHLAKKLKESNLDVYTMINFEMIGVPLNDRDYLAFVSGYDRSNMAVKLNEYAGHKLVGFSEVSKKYQLFKRSDNYSFYEAFGAPCQSISSCDLSNFDYYHHVSDESELMDYEFMSNLINSIIPAIEEMSNTLEKEIVMNQAQSDG
ncbi:peptidase M28 [Flavobacteriales bacterium 34_180_T64]|nr:peptidase M28 [Flavobacteriales bacterium 34_180_T64]